MVYIIYIRQLGAGEALAGGGVAERVYDGVARYPDAALDALAPEVFGVAGRGGEVEGGDLAGQAAVHLLGPGAPAVEGAQAGLDVADGYARVEGGEGSGEGGGRVPVDEDEPGLFRLEHRAEALEHPGGDVCEALAALHDVEVVLRRDAELAQDAVQHLAVLGGYADHALKLGPALKLQDEGGHFDGLGPRAEDGHDFKP